MYIIFKPLTSPSYCRIDIRFNQCFCNYVCGNSLRDIIMGCHYVEVTIITLQIGLTYRVRSLLYDRSYGRDVSAEHPVLFTLRTHIQLHTPYDASYLLIYLIMGFALFYRVFRVLFFRYITY